jgi:hypothetical protein
MPNHVCNGAILMCSFGMAPGVFTVLPINRKTTSVQPSGTIMDIIPLANIPSFGMCTCPANPVVAAATAAALGVLTPMPCIPGTVTPWAPGSPNVTLSNIPTIEETDTLMCMWGGLITVSYAGQVTQTVS